MSMHGIVDNRGAISSRECAEYCVEARQKFAIVTWSSSIVGSDWIGGLAMARKPNSDASATPAATVDWWRVPGLVRFTGIFTPFGVGSYSKSL
jgi:hypothetical protein